MIFRSAYDIVREVWMHRKRMLRIVAYDIRIENRSLYLGTLWKILTPLIQIGTFWFVFGVGIRGGEPVDGLPFLVWLLAGLIPWFLFSRAISNGASSIRSKAMLILKIKYPIATVPVGAIIICLYDHFIMLVILVAVFFFHGVFPSLYWLNLIYYIFFSFMFLTALSMVFSVLVMLAQDLNHLINSLLQALFFFTPILWSDGGLPPWLRNILAANPVRYVVTGFRGSLLYQLNFFSRPGLMAFFWGMTLCLFLLGCYMQKKYANRFVDWL